jgi:hypothetical protein
MTLLPKFLIVATVALVVPAPALAQVWPVIVVASAPTLGSSARTVSPRTDMAKVARQRAERPSATRHRLNLDAPSTLPRPADAPLDIEIRPKSDWSDDQGFSISATRLAFKRRF